MKPIWIVVLAAGICQPADADNEQAMAPGLWEFTTATSGAAKPPDRTQLCTDAGTADLVKQLSGRLGMAQCSKEQKRQGDTVTVDSICQMGPSKVSAHAVSIASGDKAYHQTITLRYGPPLAGMSESSVTSDAKWIGPCKEGMQPGDYIMPDGMKVNVSNMLRSMPAGATAPSASQSDGVSK